MKIISIASEKSLSEAPLLLPPSLSVYIHFPWCVKKCPYCDFNSHALPNRTLNKELETTYLDTLALDLQTQLPLVWGRPIHSVYIGGGTPSLLSARGMDKLLNTLYTLLPLDSKAEITVEVNPGTVLEKHFIAYKEAGINRLSIGVQSLNESALQRLGRIHTQEEALHTLAWAQKHFSRVNADLMYSLSLQTLQEAEEDVTHLIHTGVNHISAYELTLEPHTPFYHTPPPLPSEKTSEAIENVVRQKLEDAGFQRYEVSAYSQPGQQSLHNLNYWLFGDYMGLGAGAHGKITFGETIQRTCHLKGPMAYQKSVLKRNFLPLFQKEVSKEDRRGEFMMNALRLVQGFDLRLYEERTSLSRTSLSASLKQAINQRLITLNSTYITPTSLGLRYLNDLIALFL